MHKSRENIYQAIQYSFPYHYIPDLGPPLFLARHWGFAASYIAALNIVSEQLNRIAAEKANPIRHVDIGCGDGAFLNFLAKMDDFNAADMTGIDIDSRALAWARLFNPGM